MTLATRPTKTRRLSAPTRGSSAWGSIPPRYEVVRCLGQGGMSCVYLAFDRETEQRVALKFLDSADPGLSERFRREAGLVARLDHPSIVRVCASGEFDGRHYIALEYLDGGPLAPGRRSPAQVLPVLRDVASALSHAHSRGVIHRDVKPDNVLVGRDGRRDDAPGGVPDRSPHRLARHRGGARRGHPPRRGRRRGGSRVLELRRDADRHRSDRGLLARVQVVPLG